MAHARIEDGRIVVEGYPEGSKLINIAGLRKDDPFKATLENAGREMSRLREFHADLHKVIGWARFANSPDPDIGPDLQDACAISSVVKFCSCFEGTKGLRQRPLKAKAIFEPVDRGIISRIKLIRNRLVAHDEQRVSGHFPFVVAAAMRRLIVATYPEFRIQIEEGDVFA